MKRLLSVLIIFAMLAALPFSAKAQWAYSAGDVNNSGTVDTTDALLILRFAVQKITLSAASQRAADTNQNGTVDTTDALLALRYAVNKISSWPDGTLAAATGTLTQNPWTGETLYRTDTAETSVDPLHTTYQINTAYNAENDLPLDSVMYYASLISDVPGLASWQKNNASGKIVGVMIPGGRDNGKEFFSYYPDRGLKDVQTVADGSLLTHSGSTYYMLPTVTYTEYKWQLVDALCKAGADYITIEEPETFSDAAYSDGFKEEWTAYYGTAWQDPTVSAEARMLTSRLMSYMWSRFFETIGERMQKSYPDVKLWVATHSTPGYVRYRNGILANMSSYGQNSYIDGIIGQTWSDTVNGPSPFTDAYLEYGTYGSCMRDGQTLYTLTDSYADGISDWEKCRYLWKKTVVGELMHPDITNFQAAVWPNRGFSPAASDYKTTLLSVYCALTGLSGAASSVYAGTPGISIAMSDTLSWDPPYSYSSTTSAAFSALAEPLIGRGIPLSVTSLDTLDSPADLSGVKVLILSYELNQPLSQQANEVLAQWVKAGGTLLTVGGTDRTDKVPSTWWAKLGKTPLTDLYDRLGLSASIEPVSTPWEITRTGKFGFFDSLTGTELGLVDANYTLCFSGSGLQPILKSDTSAFFSQAACGKGRILSCGLPVWFFFSGHQGTAAQAQDWICDLVRYACNAAGIDYLESDTMTARRGSMIAVEGLAGCGGTVMNGRFIDLFDPTLPVKTTVEVNADDSLLLYDISALTGDSRPRLAFTGGDLRSQPTEEATRTVFTILGPTNSVSATRLLGNGKTPLQVSAVNKNGAVTVQTDFDAATGSLLIRTPMTAQKEITVTVEWQ